MSAMFPVVPVLWRTAPSSAAPLEFDPLRRRWLYVFQRGGDQPSRWIREVWVDEEGQCCPALEADELTPGPAARRPTADASKRRPMLILPSHLPSWGRAIYRLVASTLRLSQEAVEALRAGHAGQLADDELLLDADFILRGDAPWWFRVTEGPLRGMFVSRVVEPLHLLDILQREYCAALLTFNLWNTPLPPPLPGTTGAMRADIERQRRETLERQKQHALIELIDGLLAGDPDDAAGLRGCLELAAFERDRDRIRTKRAELLGEMEAAAGRLVGHLRGQAMRACVQSHEECREADDLANLLVAYANGCDGLQASPTGRAFIDELVRDPRSPLNLYVVPPEPLTGAPLAAVRKGAAAVLALYAEALPTLVGLKHPDPDLAFKLLLHLNNSLGNGLLTLTDEVLDLPDLGGAVLEQHGRRVKALRMHRPTLEALTSPGLHFERAVRGLEVANLLVALSGTLEDPDLLNVLGLIGSGLDFAVAFERPLTETLAGDVAAALTTDAGLFYRRCFGVAAIVSGLIDAGSAVWAMRGAKRISDDSVFAGNGLVAVGSLLGVYHAAAALGVVVLTPWGLAAVLATSVVFIAVGTVLVAFTGDTAWQTFLQHCRWGDPGVLGPGSERPGWSPVPLHELRRDLDAQLTALLNLTLTFQVDVPRATGAVKVTPGLLGASARFELVLEVAWLNAPLERHAFDLAWDGQARDPDGFPVRFEGEAGGWTALTVGLSPHIRARQGYVMRVTWYVRLRPGGGAGWIPTDGWVRANLGESASWADGQVVPALPPFPR